jgi:site-specific DNA-methyltransferase (adenine-specific)
MELNISQIIVEDRIREDLGDIDTLAASIKEYGQFYPILINKENKLLEGGRRLEACKLLGIPIKVKILDVKTKYHAFLIEKHGNLHKSFTWDEEVKQTKIEKELYEEEFPETKKGVAQAIGMNKMIGNNVNDNLSLTLPPTYTETKADVTGKSKRTVERKIQAAKALEEMPELKEEKSMNAALKKYEKIKIKEKRKEEISVKEFSNFVLGNSLEELNKLDNNSIDCVITDPPYGIDYVSNHRTTKDGVAKKIKSDNPEEAFELWENICKILINKMKDNSHLYVFTSWKVWHIFRKITEKYFTIKNCLIWEKNNWSMGDLEGNYAEQYEMILFATKGNHDLIGKREPNILHFNRVPASQLTHSCEKPVDLLEFLISKSTIEGELIVDPFVGSGSTLKAAKKMNRNWWGCEIDKDHYETAIGKLA